MLKLQKKFGSQLEEVKQIDTLRKLLQIPTFVGYSFVQLTYFVTSIIDNSENVPKYIRDTIDLQRLYSYNQLDDEIMIEQKIKNNMFTLINPNLLVPFLNDKHLLLSNFDYYALFQRVMNKNDTNENFEIIQKFYKTQEIFRASKDKIDLTTEMKFNVQNKTVSDNNSATNFLFQNIFTQIKQVLPGLIFIAVLIMTIIFFRKYSSSKSYHNSVLIEDTIASKTDSFEIFPIKNYFLFFLLVMVFLSALIFFLYYYHFRQKSSNSIQKEKPKLLVCPNISKSKKGTKLSNIKSRSSKKDTLKMSPYHSKNKCRYINFASNVIDSPKI